MRENQGAATVVWRLSRFLLALVLAATGCQSPEPPPEPPSTEGFRQYTKGTRIIEARSRAFPVTTLRFQVTPRKSDLKLFIRCDLGESDQPVDVYAEVDGKRVVYGRCPSSETDAIKLDPAATGRPIDVAVTVQQKRDKGAFAVAVGEVVPDTEYNYPPRPESLRPLGPPIVSTNTIIRPGADKAIFAWQGQGLLVTRLNTPGVVRVHLDGTEVGRCESWDYKLELCSLRLSDVAREHPAFPVGQQMTLTAVAERTTGEWDVAAHL